MVNQPESENPGQRAKEITAAIIGEGEYAQLRLHPVPGRDFYLHLKDLRAALGDLAANTRGVLLDYGCGGSPYRILFPNVDYRRADFTPSAGLDYVVQEDQRVSVPNGSFDIVLSTQVLEHVRAPEVYLAECLRILCPGGILILTTHGLFEEHGCPFDFRRWTADGLRQEVNSAGFEVEQLKKLTTGPRAAGFLFRQYGGMLASGRRTLLGLLHWFFFRRTNAYFSRIDRRLDREFPQHAVVDASEPGHALYIALLVVARKPS